MKQFKIARQEFFENIDIFGIGINIRLSQKQVHRSQLGGLVSLMIIFLMAYKIKLVFDNFTDSKNPTVLFEQRFTKSPERFDLSFDKFSLMFGLLDPKSQHFMDPSIYKITLMLKRTKKTQDPNTGEFISQNNHRNVTIEPCTPQHFQLEAVKEYFLKQKYASMYCISLQESDIYIEGQFDADYYARLEFIVESCSGDKCSTPEQQQAKLNNGRLAIYYTDNAVVPSDKENPFQPLGRQSFWVSGPQFTKSLEISVRNTYLNTDNGFLFQDLHEERTLTFSFDREQTTQKNGNVLYDCYFSFEKNMNSVYKRSYEKFDRSISQIGGTFNVLFALGCILCKPLSQIELDRKLIKRIFNFEDEKDDNCKQNLNQSREKSMFCSNLEELKANDTPNYKQSNTGIFNQSKQLGLSKSILANFSDSLNNDRSPNYANQYENVKGKRQKRSNSFLFKHKQKEQQSKDLEKIFKQQSNSIKIKRHEYFINFFKCFKICKNRNQRLIQKGVDKLYNHLDIFYLLNKLLEIEKLKHLLLNEDQIKLFEFIPKPTLTSQDKKPQYASDKIGLLYENNKNLVEKTAEAHESFKKICKKGESVTNIDLRLLELLDPRFKSFLTDLDTKQDEQVTKQQSINDFKGEKIDLQIDDNILCSQIPHEISVIEQYGKNDRVDNFASKVMFSDKNKFRIEDFKKKFSSQ